MGDAFILGAGFSKAIDDQMPTLHDLSRGIFPFIRDEDPRLANELKGLGNNVELWMSLLSQTQPWLDIGQVQHNLSIAHLIREQICSVIDEQTLKIETAPEWLNTLIEKWHDHQATVLTLNYDTLIERVACGLPLPRDEEDEHELGLHPVHLYPPYFEFILGRMGYGVWGRKSRETFSLLKLHGSTNWYYSGQTDFYGETILYADVSPIGDETTREESQRAQAKDKVPLIIPPVTEKRTYFNNESVRCLWREAANALESADSVFVIGYSLPPTDIGMMLFLATVLGRRSVNIFVVDIDNSVPKRLQNLLGSTHIHDKYAYSGCPVNDFAEDYCSENWSPK